MPVTTYTVIMTTEPSRIGVPLDKGLEDGHDGELDECCASEKTLPRFLAKLQIKKIREHWWRTPRQPTIPLVFTIFRAPKQTLQIESRMCMLRKGVYVDGEPTEYDNPT